MRVFNAMVRKVINNGNPQKEPDKIEAYATLPQILHFFSVVNKIKTLKKVLLNGIVQNV